MNEVECGASDGKVFAEGKCFQLKWPRVSSAGTDGFAISGWNGMIWGRRFQRWNLLVCVDEFLVLLIL